MADIQQMKAIISIWTEKFSLSYGWQCTKKVTALNSFNLGV